MIRHYLDSLDVKFRVMLRNLIPNPFSHPSSFIKIHPAVRNLTKQVKTVLHAKSDKICTVFCIIVSCKTD